MNLQDSSNRILANRAQTDHAELLRRFPKEIWILIFTKLCHSLKSVYGFLSASVVFRNMVACLYGNISEVTFQFVWTLLLNYRHDTEAFVPPFRRTFLDTILKCRKVCKKWCQAVDRSFETAFVDFAFPDESLDFEGTRTKSSLVLAQQMRLVHPRNARVFINHFQTTHTMNFDRSPFIAGTVKFIVRDEFENVLQVAMVYGKQVRHCELEFGAHGEYFNLHETLCLILPHMPNLQTLKCKWFPREDSEPQEIAERILPTLPHLQTLIVTTCSPESLAKILTKYGFNLRYLCIDDPLIHELPLTIRFPNIKVLKISTNNPDYLHILNVAPNADTVVLRYIPDLDYEPRWPLFYILQYINEKVPQTCKNLVLHLPHIPLMEERMVARLCLRNVRKLKLYLRHLMPLDFLLGMQETLEVLCVFKTKSNITLQLPWMDTIMKNEVVKYMSSFDNMEASNVWQLFPRLRTLMIEMEKGICMWKKTGN